MTVSKAIILFAPVLLLAACEREQAPPPPAAAPPAAAVARPPAAWFICDALNKPVVLVVGQPDEAGESTILTIDKTDDHPPVARRYAVGAPTVDATAAQVRTLSREGAVVGHVQTLDAARLTTPPNATTPPVVEVKLDDQTLSCRWLLRTRLFGLAAGRTVLVTDEAEGPLLRTFDFKAPVGGRVLPDGAQRSSQPTVRLEAGRLEGGRYVFVNDGYGYVVDDGGVAVTQDGQKTTEEPFVAVQRGRD